MFGQSRSIIFGYEGKEIIDEIQIISNVYLTIKTEIHRPLQVSEDVTVFSMESVHFT